MKSNPDPNTKRECGSCFACCVYLGITALAKYPGQSCKHLARTNIQPKARCTIYPTRPSACSGYQCSWRLGMNSDLQRPDLVGFLSTAQPLDPSTFDSSNPHGSPSELSLVVMCWDMSRAGNLADPTSPLAEHVALALEMGIEDIRIVYLENKTVAWIKPDGIRLGKLQKPESFEDLTFSLVSLEPVFGLKLQAKEEI